MIHKSPPFGTRVWVVTDSLDLIEARFSCVGPDKCVYFLPRPDRHGGFLPAVKPERVHLTRALALSQLRKNAQERIFFIVTKYHRALLETHESDQGGSVGTGVAA